MCRYVWCMLFLCACVVQGRFYFTFFIFTHRDKYILIQTNKAVSRHSNSSTSAYRWYITLDDSTLADSVNQTPDVDQDVYVC